MLETIKLLRAMWNDRRGVTALEYAVVAAVVATGVATAFASFGTNLAAKITNAIG